MKNWVAVLTLAILAGVAGLFPAELQLDRSAVAEGQVWRLWSAHLVHGNWIHFRYDVIAAALLGLAFGRVERLLVWAPIVSLGLLAVPGLEQYFGLSSILHGWVVLEAGRLAQTERSTRARVAALMCCLTVAKAALETYLNASLVTGDLDFGGQISHVSHLVGASLGVVALAASKFSQRAEC